MFESMRKSAMRLVSIQIAAGALAGALAGAIFGSAAAVSTLSGAGVGLAGSLVMVAALLRARPGAAPPRLLAGLLAGEAAKLVATAAGFALCIVKFDMHLAGLLAGFAATLAGYWAGLLPAVLGETARPAAIRQG